MARVPGTFNPKTKLWEGEIPGTHEPSFVEPPLREREGDGLHAAFDFGECLVLLSLDGGRWHISISHPHRHPSWDEIKTVRYRLGGPDLVFAMVLPEVDRYVNVPEQDHVMQLWQLVGGEAEGW